MQWCGQLGSVGVRDVEYWSCGRLKRRKIKANGYLVPT